MKVHSVPLLAAPIVLLSVFTHFKASMTKAFVVRVNNPSPRPTSQHADRSSQLLQNSAEENTDTGSSGSSNSNSNNVVKGWCETLG